MTKAVVFGIIFIIGIIATINQHIKKQRLKEIVLSIISTIALGLFGNYLYSNIDAFLSVNSNKSTKIVSEESYSVLTQVVDEYSDYIFTKPEEIDYKNITNLNNYVRLKDTYGNIFAAPTCLYTKIEYDTENILFTGNDDSSLSYKICDLIEELPEFSPKWTEHDIIQYITKSTNGTIKNIEIIYFSTKEKRYYIKGTDSKNKNLIIYLMVALGNTMYKTLELKIPQYTDINDEIMKEYYAECMYRLSDFMEASEKVRTYNEFYKDYKNY